MGKASLLLKNNIRENMIEILWSDLVTSYSQANENSSLVHWRAIQLDQEKACWYNWMTAVKITLLNHVVQVVNEYPCRGEWRLRLCTWESGISRTSVHNGSVQHCCNLCKSTKLNIIKANFFLKTLILIPLADVQLQCSVPELYFFFGANRGKNQDPSPCQKINDICPHGGSYAREFCIMALVVLRCSTPFCFNVMCADY